MARSLGSRKQQRYLPRQQANTAPFSVGAKIRGGHFSFQAAVEYKGCAIQRLEVYWGESQASYPERSEEKTSLRPKLETMLG